MQMPMGGEEPMRFKNLKEFEAFLDGVESKDLMQDAYRRPLKEADVGEKAEIFFREKFSTGAAFDPKDLEEATRMATEHAGLKADMNPFAVATVTGAAEAAAEQEAGMAESTPALK